MQMLLIALLVALTCVLLAAILWACNHVLEKSNTWKCGGFWFALSFLTTIALFFVIPCGSLLLTQLILS